MQWVSMLNSFGEFVPGTDSWISFSLMKAEQTIRDMVTVPMPNSQGYNVSLFFQDYFPGYKRVKLNLKGVLSGGLPFIAPRTKYEDVKSTFRTPAYKRVISASLTSWPEEPMRSWTAESFVT